MILKIKSIDELKGVSHELKPLFEKYKIVLLEGSMAAGKTTFVKEYCKFIGVKDDVSSPTFGLVNEYETNEGQKIYHFDLYRVEEEEELYDIGFEEYVDSGNLCFIEWPSIAENFIPIKHILLNLLVDENGRRKIQVNTKPNEAEKRN